MLAAAKKRREKKMERRKLKEKPEKPPATVSPAHYTVQDYMTKVDEDEAVEN